MKHKIKIKDCCDKTLKNKKGLCVRKKDNKTFKLPRRFAREKCLKGVRGFTMKSSCAPFKNCTIKVVKKGKKRILSGGKKQKRYRKNKKNKKIKCICVFHNIGKVSGVIKFSQKTHSKKVKVEYEINGLSDGEHGFHIHECGDLTSGCSSACAHFNPFNKNHGGKYSKERHVGDLGNIVSRNNIAKGYFYDKLISLKHNSKCCIIGRAVVVHQDKDDLGKGGDAESLKTGNAGKRVGCGVIGLAK